MDISKVTELLNSTVTQNSGSVAQKATSAKDSLAMGKDQFMKLLVAQLRYQDPMKPVENTEFVTQLAQLNAVEQMTLVNQTLKELVELEGLSRASGLIGRKVEATGSDGQTLQGVVSEVKVLDGVPLVVVEGTTIKPKEITRVLGG